MPGSNPSSLVLENDEICYNVDDLLPVCEELNIPLVFGALPFRLACRSSRTRPQTFLTLSARGSASRLPPRLALPVVANARRAHAPHARDVAAQGHQAKVPPVRAEARRRDAHGASKLLLVGLSQHMVRHD